jgi:hypothetical protein
MPRGRGDPRGQRAGKSLRFRWSTLVSRPFRGRLAPKSAVVAALGILAAYGGIRMAQAADPVVVPNLVSIPVPELPPVWVLEPALYDQNGCQLMPPSEDAPSDAEWVPFCGSVDSPAEEDQSQDDSTWRSLLGFAGPYFAKQGSGELVLLPGSVFVTSDGPWRAWGFVRNESLLPLGATVTAALFDGGGNALATVTTEVPVTPLRPGEPGPFMLASDTPVSEVAQVEWSVNVMAPAPPKARDFLVMLHWGLPYGDRPPFDLVYTDPVGPPPYPYVLAGEAENLHSLPVATPSIVVAWLDESLRVRWLASVRAGDVPFNPENAAIFPSVLEPRVTVPFFVPVSDPQIAPLLADLEPVVWVMGS